jgi:hypothetical protein
MKVFDFLERIDRRVIFALVALSLAVPLLFKSALEPAPMKTADEFYRAVEALDPTSGKIVLIAADFGPGTMAENRPQTAVAIEHLMRRRIPFAMISMYPQAEPFLREIPQTIANELKEETGQEWVYGKDWVNFGFRPNFLLMIQGFSKTEDLHAFFKADANSVPLSEIPVMKSVKTIRDVQMLMEFTGLVGVFNTWLQYFNADGYTPPFLYGCTSITIPEAYIYYSSRQILGFFEGIAGAAWYEKLLGDAYPARPKRNTAIQVNTGLSYAHLVIIAFIALGNIGVVAKVFTRRQTGEARR